MSSHLPNEVDWAFNKLIKLSGVCPDNFSVASIPGLLDEMLLHAEPFFAYVEKIATANKVEENSILKASEEDEAHLTKELFTPALDLQPEHLERALQVYHIVRNFSFIELSAPSISNWRQLNKFLFTGLSCPMDVPSSSEFKLYALDTLENIAPQYKIDPASDLLKHLQKLVHDNDRAMILGAVRTFSRMISNEDNEDFFSDLPPAFFQRLLQLLFVFDEEIVATVMELLYQYSTLMGHVASKIVDSSKANVVHILLKFLEWKTHSIKPRSASYSQHRVSQILEDPQKKHLYNWYFSMTCLYSFLRLRTQYQTDPEGIVVQIDMYSAYAKHCADLKIPALNLTLFMQICGLTFSQITTFTHNQKFIIKGIKSINERGSGNIMSLSSDSMDIQEEKAEDMFLAEDDGTESPWKTIKKTYAKDQDNQLWKDIVGSLKDGDTVCLWKTCDFTSDSKQKLALHIKTHFPFLNSHSTEAKQRDGTSANTPNIVGQTSHQTVAMQQQQIGVHETSSIPLLAALVLRNLARVKDNKHLFLPYEFELLRLISVHRTESVIRVILSILYEISNSEK